jgi:dihydrodiol dehydrogenase / D-xylose 1-dehydrogenase (NADP)
VADADIDIVYIATPHSHHYANVLLCLHAGKHVLCEKAFTVNAAQAKILAATAREKKLLLMEGLWTRYFPVSAYVREVITSGRIGRVERVLAEHSLPYAEGFEDKGHIMVNPALAGGILLDAGVYSLMWVFMCLYSVTEQRERRRPRVLAASARYEETGVDAMTSMVLAFPRGGDGEVHGVATCSLGLSADKPAAEKRVSVPSVRISGLKGEIQVFPPTYRPTRTRLVLRDGTVEERQWPQPGPGEGSGYFSGFADNKNAEGEGHGLFWEADDAARAIRDGRREGSQLGLDESVLIMETLDEVRRQAGVRYPDTVESTEYP